MLRVRELRAPDPQRCISNGHPARDSSSQLISLATETLTSRWVSVVTPTASTMDLGTTLSGFSPLSAGWYSKLV
jgi:hypothetical protein